MDGADEKKGEDLYAYLRERGIEDSIISKMKEEKIDEYVLPLMSEEEVTKYISHKGERVLAIDFCRRATHTETSMMSKNKSTLFTRITEKLSKSKRTTTKGPRCSSPDPKHLKGNPKPDRVIEIGWCHFSRNDNRYAQVKKTTGGGTRYPRMDKSADKQTIMNEARSLFFPNGFSPLGEETDVKMDLSLDNKGLKIVSSTDTVGSLYELLKVRYLRFYLLTIPHYVDSTSEITPSNRDTEVLCSAHREQCLSNSSTDSLPDPLNIAVQTSTHTNSLDNEGASNVSTFADMHDFTPSTSADFSTSDALGEVTLYDLDSSIQTDIISDINNYIVDDEIEFGFANTLPTPQRILDQTLETPVITIELHRGHVLTELIQYLIAHEVNTRISKFEIRMLLPNGAIEAGEDNGGVMRDALSEFWNTFYVKHTAGDKLKVPVISHRMTGKHWTACAQVLAIGYKQEHYLPIELAAPFLRNAIFGIRENHSDLVETFLNYIPDYEKNILVSAINDYTSIDFDELLEVLDSHQVKTTPTNTNIRHIVEEVAHKELIQGPAYVAECWVEILKDTKELIGEDFDNHLLALVPSAKKILALLRFTDDLTREQAQTAEFLRKYVKSLSSIDLAGKFLRFCTGADILINKEIGVRFVANTTHFCRTPVAHTCGCVLELQDNYESMQDLREEFNGILNSGIWVMDIV